MKLLKGQFFKIGGKIMNYVFLHCGKRSVSRMIEKKKRYKKTFLMTATLFFVFSRKKKSSVTRYSLAIVASTIKYC